jgi:hypothetical protein
MSGNISDNDMDEPARADGNEGEPVGSTASSYEKYRVEAATTTSNAAKSLK